MAMIKIREVEDKDLISLSEFLPLGFPATTKEFWIPQFNFWWTSNPAYNNKIPRGWVLEKDSIIVGFIGNIPLKVLVHGKESIAAACNSWYVDSSVRGIFSLMLFNEYLKQKNVCFFLFKQENESLTKILHKYKFKDYILPKSQKEYAYILDKKKVRIVIKKFLFTRKISKVSDLMNILKRLKPLFFAYLYQKPIIEESVLPKEYISSLCTSCDDAFLGLWKPYLNSCDVALSHDKNTLKWLFFQSSKFNKRTVIQCHKSLDKTLAGYMVFDILQKEPSASGSMQLVDMCIKNNNPQTLKSIISFAIEMGKQNNIALLIVWANSREIEKFFQRTFTLRRDNRHYRYIKLSEIYEMNPDTDNYDNVCLPMIFPPQ
jgi:hypothetical protein